MSEHNTQTRTQDPLAVGWLVKSVAQTVGTTAVKITAGLTERSFLQVQNLSSGYLFIGGADVSESNGIRVDSEEKYQLGALVGCEVYMISDTAAQDVRTIEGK